MIQCDIGANRYVKDNKSILTHYTEIPSFSIGGVEKDQIERLSFPEEIKRRRRGLETRKVNPGLDYKYSVWYLAPLQKTHRWALHPPIDTTILPKDSLKDVGKVNWEVKIYAPSSPGRHRPLLLYSASSN